MTKNDRVVIEIAVAVLRHAVAQDDAAAVRGDAIRLALRVLLPHCREKWPLVNFWDSARQDHDIGRTQGVAAAFNAIVRQLRLPDAYRG